MKTLFFRKKGKFSIYLNCSEEQLKENTLQITIFPKSFLVNFVLVTRLLGKIL